MPWAPRAACRDADELLWVTDASHEKNIPYKTVEKLAICAECPVRVECLRYSLQGPFEVFGVWGATTQLERRSFSRVLSTLRAGRDAEKRAEAVEEIVAFFEKTRRRRLAHWRALAKEMAGLPSPHNVPTARARPPIVAAAGLEMARRFAEEKEQAHIAAAGTNWRER